MQSRFVVYLATISAMAMQGVISVPLHAQTPTSASKASKGESLFFIQLQQLATREKIALVIEGDATRTVIPATGLPPLPLNASTNQQINRLADINGYEAELHGQVYVLSKRYNIPQDIPDVSPGEVVRDLETLIRVITPFGPHVPAQTKEADPLTDDLFRSFSSQQVEQLKEGISTTTLSDQQQAEVRKIGQYFYLQVPLRDSAEIVRQLHVLQKPEAALVVWKAPTGNIISVSYEDAPGHTGYLALYNQPTPTKASDAVETSESPKSPSPDKATPSSLDSSQTLGVAATIFFQRWHTPDLIRLKIDPELADKKVTIVGDKNSEPNQLLDALAFVYGLRLVREHSPLPGESDELHLTFPRPALPKTMSDLSFVGRSILPRPLLRALLGTARPATSSTDTADRKTQLLNLAPTDSMARALYSSGLRQEVNSRLHQLIAKPLSQSPNKQILLSDCTSEVKNLLAVALCLSAHPNIFARFSEGKVPGYITAPENVYIRGGSATGTDGVKWFAVSLCRRQADGRLANYVMISSPQNRPNAPQP